MTLQEQLRTWRPRDGSMTRDHLKCHADAADRIDKLEAALEYIVGFEGPNRGKEADEMRRVAIATLAKAGGE